MNRELRLLAIVQTITLVLVLILVIDRFALPKSSPGVGQAIAGNSADTANRMSNIIRTDINDYFVSGNKTAPNTMVLYSRYNCDYCRSFEQTLDTLKNNEVNSGKLKIIYKDYVAPADTLGLIMARVAEVARQKGKFLQIRNMFMSRPLPPDSAAIVALAVESGIDQPEMAKGLNDAKTIRKVETDYQSGKMLGITGTPAFLLNGRLFIGAISYKELLAHINN